MNRLEKLQEVIRREDFEALLISHSDNIRYISGFSGSTATLCITATRSFLITDSRYIEQAGRQAPGFDIIQSKGDASRWLVPLISQLSLRRIGFEETYLTFSEFQKYKAYLTGHDGVSLVPSGDIIGQLRMVKDQSEIESIRKSAGLADMAVEYASTIIKEGISEKEVAWSTEKFLRENGSEKLPFDIIVASGPNAALPHAMPTDRVLKNGDTVVIDLGASFEGYCSDITRTFCCGKSDDKFDKLYDITLAAQLAAINTIATGMDGKTADGVARAVIIEAGYGEAFGHSLGHGIGLAVHELPRLGPNSSDILSNNMVFSIEPGIYLPGWGGIRIEDTVLLENGKITLLTMANKVSPR